jgi:opacity protein-like surface antigen
MKKTIWLICSILLVGLLSATGASAQDWYFGALTSYSDTDDTDFETAVGTVTTTFDSDMSYALIFGRQLQKVRVEGELFFREADVEDHLLAGTALPESTGEASGTSLMANVLYDFNREGTVSPYIGAGLGYTDVDFENFGVGPIPSVLEDSDSSFAYQLLLGLGFNVNEQWTVFLDYRWFAADDLSVTVSPAAGATATDIDYEVQDLSIGFRVAF